MTELRLSVRHHGDRATIHIGGEIDLATCPQLQAIVVDLVDRGCHQLIVDLDQVSFLDCAGMRVSPIRLICGWCLITFARVQLPMPFRSRNTC